MKTGIQKGDRIAVLSENRHEWCTAYLAISLAGAVAVPIDAQYGPEEIKNLLTDSESRIIFHSTKTQEKLLNAHLICYGKRIAGARLGLGEVHDRAPALAPTPFGLACMERFARELGPLP